MVRWKGPCFDNVREELDMVIEEGYAISCSYCAVVVAVMVVVRMCAAKHHILASSWSSGYRTYVRL